MTINTELVDESHWDIWLNNFGTLGHLEKSWYDDGYLLTIENLFRDDETYYVHHIIEAKNIVYNHERWLLEDDYE